MTEWKIKDVARFHLQAKQLITDAYEGKITVSRLREALDEIVPDDMYYEGYYGHLQDVTTKKDIIKAAIINMEICVTHTEKILLACVKRRKNELARFLLEVQMEEVK